MEENVWTRARLVGCGCIIWNGRLGVAVQVHPSVAASPDTASRVLKRFLSCIVGDDGPADDATLSGFAPWEDVEASSEIIAASPVG